MKNQNLFIDIQQFDLNTLKIHDPYEDTNDIIRIDLSRDKLKSVMLYIDYLPIISFNNKQCNISLKSSPEIKKKIDDIDALIVSELQQRKITKKLKKKFSYRQMVSTVNISEGESVDILNLNVNVNVNVNTDSNESKFNTKIYVNSHSELSHEQATNLMKNNCLIKLVVELTSIVIDKENSLIYVDNIIRQIKIKKIKPNRILNLPYSFVDSEPESDIELNSDVKLDSNINIESNKNEDIKFNTNDEDIVKNILDYSVESDTSNYNNSDNDYLNNSD